MKNLPKKYLLAIFFCALAGPALGQGISRIKDINTQVPSASTLADTMVNVNGTLFLATDDLVSGSELWKSNGTQAGTVLVRDLRPGLEDSLPQQLTAVGTGASSRLFFTALSTDPDGTAGDRQLFRSDGTFLGTTQITTSNFPLSEGPERLFAIGNTLFFTGYEPTTKRELWKSDLNGNAALVKDINPSSSSQDSGVNNLVNLGGVLYFTADDGTLGNELWRSDGTTAGTVQVADIQVGPGSGRPENLIAFNGDLYFTAFTNAEGRELWRSDGTTTELVRDLQPGTSGGNPQDFAIAGSNLYFTADVTVNSVPRGREIWRTDGLSVPIFVADIIDGAPGSEPESFTPITVTVSGGQTEEWVVFSAIHASQGRELFRSNGAAFPSPGTQVVQDLAAGAGGSNPENFVKLSAGTVLFTANNAAGTLGLYRAAGGTNTVTATLVTQIPNMRQFTLASEGGANVVYFLGNDDELWRSDGTTGGTVRIKRIRTGDTTAVTAGSFPTGFTTHQGMSFFAAADGISGTELWKTDGSAGNTAMVADNVPGATSTNPQWLTSGGAHIYFSAVNGSGDRELYRSEGSFIELIKNIHPSSSSQPEDLFWHNGLLFFSATEPTNGRELWRSDGTDAGTFLVENINASSNPSSPADFVLFRNRIYFSGGATGIGRELLSTLGAQNDVDKTLDISSGGSSSGPLELTVMKDKFGVEFLYFSASAESKGRELWKSDGTKAGTKRVKDINSGSAGSDPEGLTPVGTTLFFAATTSAGGTELWKSDGSEAMTVLVKEIVAGTGSSSPSQLIEVEGKLFFVATDANGSELWISDGTAAGTKLVKDIVAGAGSPDIRELSSINGLAVFTANDGVNGREVWISDGTTAGTLIVDDLTDDAASSSPNSIARFGNNLIFTGTSYAAGAEPYIGLLEPEIVVEQVAGVELANGSTVNAGDVTLVNSQNIVFNIGNEGLNVLKNLKYTLSGPQASEFTIVGKPATSVPQESAIQLTIKFVPKALGTRTAQLLITNNDTDEGAFTLSLQGNGVETFTAHPMSQLVNVGDPVSFTATVNPAGLTPPTIQWQRNKANILGATAIPYNIPAAALTHAGAYTVVAKQNTSASSSIGELGVVENIPGVLVVALNAGGTLKVNTAGNGLAYKWRRQFGANPAEDLTDTVRFKGITTKSLAMTKLTTADSAVYFCEVTGPGGMVVGGTTELRVFTAAPEITEFNPPDGIVSGPYSYQLIMNPDTTKAATTFAAAKLPTGLKVDTKTGRIYGFPTKLGSFDIAITASNAKGKHTLMKTVQIAKFPDNLAGVYTGIVERNMVLNGGLGGKIDLTITPTGTFTGSLSMGNSKLALKGQLNVDVDQTGAGFDPNCTVTIKRTGTLPPLNVFFEIENNLITGNSQVNDNTNIAAVDGWRQIFNATTNLADEYQGYYTMGLRVAAGPTDLPQGQGYGSFTVAKDGKLTVAGKTPDGEGLTGATFVGPTGQVLIYQLLYTTPVKGSMQGHLVIGLGADPTPANTADNTIAGALDWVRPPDTRTSARTYETGFGTPMPIDLEAFGGRYGPITGTMMVMGLAEGDAVSLDFSGGGLDASGDDPDLFFNLGAKNKVILPPAAQNPSAVKFTLAAATGIFSGSFTLDDPNPRTVLPVTPASVKRTVNYYGIITQEAGDPFGAGYFMLPRLPSDGPPPTTPTTSDILSGSVLFEGP